MSKQPVFDGGMKPILPIFPVEILVGIIGGALVFAIFLPPIYAVLGGILGGGVGIWYSKTYQKPTLYPKTQQRPPNDVNARMERKDEPELIDVSYSDRPVQRIGSNRR